MKLLATALVLFCALSSPELARAQGSQQQNFSFSQSTQVLNLDQREVETIYRTDQVPDTCYRDEVQGTRRECHTEYDRQCHTSYENQCRWESYPVCQTVPRNVCRMDNVCRTQMDSVCDSHGCHTVPRNVCHAEQHCSTQMDSVCHNEQRQVCSTVPVQSCQEIPRQACMDVPNVVHIPYACTRPVRTPIGEELKMHTVAVVNVTLDNFADVDASGDVLTATLSSGKVTIEPSENSSYDYEVLDQKRTEQVISANEKRVTYTFHLQAN